jgi:CHAD domain-containing protein
MAYRFKKTESLPHAVRRVFGEEIDWAVGQLTTSKKRARAVHEARKSMKKIRGLLSLIANKLGPLYKPEDRFFGHSGKKLSDLRDGAIMLEVFHRLAAAHPQLELGHVRRILERRHQCDARSEKRLTGEVARLLKESQAKTSSWPIDDLTVDALLPNLSASYRKTKKALKHAQKRPDEKTIHNLRKEVKHHFYHVRLLEDFWPSPFKKRAADLDNLETCLGDSNNLSVLRLRIEADVETTADRQEVRELTRVIDEQIRNLRERGLALASHLYADKPRKFYHQFIRLRPLRFPARAARAVA